MAGRRARARPLRGRRRRRGGRCRRPAGAPLSEPRAAGMRRGEAWALVDALAACAPRFGTEARPEKLRLLARLATVQIASAPTLERLHESLCFVRAYPDDVAVLDAAERSLREFAVRVRRLPSSA